MNTGEFTHVNETSFSRPGPIEINSDTPIIYEEVYERHYGNYQENEEVEINEEDLDDIPTSPDLNSTKVSPQEDNLSVGTSRPLLFQLEHSKEWFAYISSLDVCENSNIETSIRGSNMVQEIFFPIPQIYLIAILFNPEYKEYGAKALVECISQNLAIKPEETPDLVTCQNSIKLIAKEMYDKYCSLDNVENRQMSTPQVGAHGRVKHKLGLDSSNKCEFVKYVEQGSDNITNDEDSAIRCGSDNSMELQDRQRALS
ncbi:hypothetical protein H5410_010345 [Solanum commersonii]|uniref:Uncharacterized protein n=1 Tax=Solanum commersonii TaxID=4109 RepID=A0A9J6AM65_SOLCO|nr:hypothetical protein H5410_010345 [Solanum commersonii]